MTTTLIMVMDVTHHVTWSLVGHAQMLSINSPHAKLCVVMAYCDKLMRSVMTITQHQVMDVMAVAMLRTDMSVLMSRLHRVHAPLCVAMVY